MVGFDDGNEKLFVLDDRVVPAINPDLTAHADISQAIPLVENRTLCFRTDEKGGPFDIDTIQAQQMLLATNLSGLNNADVVRPYLNALDLLRRSRKMWVIDFGCDVSEEEAVKYAAPFEYLRRTVKPFRETVRNPRERTLWWLHRRPAPDMRKAVASLRRYIATPALAKYRLFVWLDTRTIPDHQLYAIARADDYFLGVLHSRLHELWARTTGTQLREAESGTRYTPTTTFETFPFPWPPDHEPHGDLCIAAIAQAAGDLVGRRDAWLNPAGAIDAELKQRTLTNLYNKRPDWLDLAHKQLDAAVFDAYGWPHDLTDDEILARLLALNLERAAAQGCVVVPVAERDEDRND
jgi:type II restriction/modification system DNA methylase subunit YeeA